MARSVDGELTRSIGLQLARADGLQFCRRATCSALRLELAAGKTIIEPTRFVMDKAASERLGMLCGVWPLRNFSRGSSACAPRTSSLLSHRRIGQPRQYPHWPSRSACWRSARPWRASPWSGFTPPCGPCSRPCSMSGQCCLPHCSQRLRSRRRPTSSFGQRRTARTGGPCGRQKTIA